MKISHKIKQKIKRELLALQTQWENWQAERAFCRYLRHGRGRNFYIMGTPQYSNLGDSAIDLAQRHFLQTIGAAKENIKEITKEEYRLYRSMILRCIRPQDVITCIGGGNMGDEWLAEENFRRQILADFPGRPVMVFPQTVYYTKTDRGALEKEKSRPYYNRENCILAAREQTSYQIMQQLYPRAAICLTPDIVLSMTAQDFGVVPQKRESILLLLRRDVESALKETERQELLSEVEKLGMPVVQTDMYAQEPVTKENRSRLVREKMQQFAGSRLVVTDRLHGMIFAAITQTPCIVLGNYNHKVEGTYAWLVELPYIRFADSLDHAKELLPQLLSRQDCTFSADALAAKFVPLQKQFQAFWAQM